MAQLARLAGEQQLEKTQASTDGDRKYKQSISFTDTLHQCKGWLVAMLLMAEDLKVKIEEFVNRLQKLTEQVWPDRESQPRKQGSVLK